MATTYEDIYDIFMSNLSNDYRLLAIFNDDVANSTKNLDIILHGWLFLGIGDFTPICNQDLTKIDETNETFTIDLSVINKNMLAKFIAKYWMKKEIHDIEQMRNKVQDSYRTYSEAQNVTAKSALLSKLEEELSQDLVDYGYSDKDMWQRWITNGFATLD